MHLSVNVRSGCYQGRLLVFVVYRRVCIAYNASHVKKNQVFNANMAAYSRAFLDLTTGKAALSTVQPETSLAAEGVDVYAVVQWSCLDTTSLINAT